MSESSFYIIKDYLCGECFSRIPCFFDHEIKKVYLQCYNEKCSRYKKKYEPEKVNLKELD